METILIFTGGDRPHPDVIDDLPRADLVIAADSGYDSAIVLDFKVDILIGDLDSIVTTPLPEDLIVQRHPRDKDQTDLDLALELAAREQPERVIVVGGAGGRHDHELAVALLLGSPRWDRIDEIDWLSSRSRTHVIRGRRIIHGDVGSTISLIPVGGDAAGITTNGLEWDLHNESLPVGSTRGVSNVMTAPVVDIHVEDGCVLMIMPHDG